MEIPSARPQVSIFDPLTGEPTVQCNLPEVFLTPIRSDLIHSVHSNMAKNKRQPYGVKVNRGPSGISAGHQHSAHSWGTGRAVSRIPRVSGSGTHKAGQGAVGNMCRGGHMFAPTKTWRKWHRKISKRQRRYATASALAASALPSLVSARGHRIDSVKEIPLVVENAAEQFKRTKEAVALLKTIGAFADVQKVIKTKTKRAGKGKMRGRMYKKRKGPLIVYKKDDGIVKAFRNIPGVDICCVDRLNLLQLAPGSYSGRFIIWTRNAFESLNRVFGTFKEFSEAKKNFLLPRYNILTNTDIARIINSDEIQSVLRPACIKEEKKKRNKKDPLKPENKDLLLNLNPYAEKSCSLELVDDE